MAPSLTECESFYVITGSSGAALTGLMFVVIALAADRIPPQRQRPEAMSIYSTPTLVHFGVVLLIAAMMTIPHQTMLTLSLGLGLSAAVGVGYTAINMVRMRRLDLYEAVLDDWIWHAILPFTAYLSLALASMIAAAAGETAFFIVAGVVLLLLFIGIHNAWDVALYTTLYRTTSEPPPSAPTESAATAPETVA